MSDRKRRAFDEQESGGSPSGPKKPRVAGIAQPSFLPPKGDLDSIAALPASLPPKPTTNDAVADAIAAAKAKIAAKLASFKMASGASVPTTAASAVPSTAGLPARPSTPDARQPSLDEPPVLTGQAKSTADAIAEARRKIEAMKAKAAKAANPYMAQAKSGTSAPAAGVSTGPGAPGIHPLLAQNDALQARTGKDRYKPMAPKFATVKANIKSAVPVQVQRRYDPPTASTSKDGAALPYSSVPTAKPGVNPYYDPNIATESSAYRERTSRKQLKFNQKGKYTRLAEQMRQEQKLEALKQRIAEASKKAGLVEDIESGALIKRPAPPDVEWWDAAYLGGKGYADLPDENQPEDAILRHIDATSISALIQHPIPIPAPGEKLQQAPKPLFLTKKEMKKLRRNRRAAEHKDMQDRIRMGLAPPPPDKVKISNMYRVLTQEAIADPTKIEARVRREMAARQNAHDKSNAARKLTDEQRREKLEKAKEKDESTGIYGAAFKVRYLSDGGQRFKVRKNADQNALSGCVVYGPKFNLVYVEGGSKGVRAYTRLMTDRIKWTEASAARATARSTPTLEGEDDAPEPAAVEAPATSNAINMDEPHNLADNYCYLVWEGQQKERSFRGFRSKACPADALAKDFLGSQQGLWDIAKRLENDGL